MAFAPRGSPKIAIAVIVENAGFGSTWAAPIASLMMEQYLVDSISRPLVYERIINGNLMPEGLGIKSDTVDKPVLPRLNN